MIEAVLSYEAQAGAMRFDTDKPYVYGVVVVALSDPKPGIAAAARL
ncbi:MAG: hypothetical protein LBU24_01445 [Methanocalculaceae archaeon]|nr:hypothetical protein [Methanocalculaceae archaeon]